MDVFAANVLNDYDDILSNDRIIFIIINTKKTSVKFSVQPELKKDSEWLNGCFRKKGFFSIEHGFGFNKSMRII